MEQLISGIQQVGIGISNVAQYMIWFKNTLGFDVKIFDDEAKAALMTRYTGGVIHSRRAVLSMNLNGGGGAELWQFTSRETEKPQHAVQMGDFGINAVKIKSSNVAKAHQKLAQNERCSPLFKTFDSFDSFWLLDEFDNVFQVVHDECFFNKKKALLGGISGVTIGVSNIEKSIQFYTQCLGISELIYDVVDSRKDWLNQTRKYRSVKLKFKNNFTAAFSQLLGNIEIELIQDLDRNPVRIFENRFWGDSGFIHVCFDVTNMELLKKRMLKNQFEFTVDSGDTFDMEDSGGRFAYVEDPDGTLIELVETHKVPILKKLNWFLDLKNRKKQKPLPVWMIKAMGLNKIKE